MAFIRKFRTGSGATGVQVCWKRGGEVVRTVHVGSANSEVMLKKLLRRAERIKLGEGQGTMFDLGEFESSVEPGEGSDADSGARDTGMSIAAERGSDVSDGGGLEAFEAAEVEVDGAEEAV